MRDTNDENIEFHDCEDTPGNKFKEQKDKQVDF